MVSVRPCRQTSDAGPRCNQNSCRGGPASQPLTAVPDWRHRRPPPTPATTTSGAWLTAGQNQFTITAFQSLHPRLQVSLLSFHCWREGLGLNRLFSKRNLLSQSSHSPTSYRLEVYHFDVFMAGGKDYRVKTVFVFTEDGVRIVPETLIR